MEPQPTQPDISVVLPVYRNRAALGELYRRLTLVLEPLAPYELIFCDDACPDDSLAVLRSLAAADERVAVLALSENVGQNRAVLIGLAYARGQVVIAMDADLQDPPQAIPGLVAALSGETAAVFAGRRGTYQSAGRMLGSRVFKRLLHALSHGQLPVDAGLFVAMRREMVERLLSYRAPQPYVLGLMARTGLPMISLPVERAPARRSGYSLRARIQVAIRALVTILSPEPRESGRPGDPVADRIGARFR